MGPPNPFAEEVDSRITYPRPPDDFTNPLKILAWAMGIRRPREGCGDPVCEVDDWTCRYIAQCVIIARAVESGPNGPLLKWQAIQGKEQRDEAQRMLDAVATLERRLRVAVAFYDANIPAGVTAR